MECHTVQDILDAYIIGALEDEQNSQIEQHIQNCAACKKYYEESVRSWQKLQELPTVSPSISYADRIINNQKRGKRIFRWTVATLTLLVISLFALFLLFFLFDYKKEYPQHHIANLEKAIWRFYSQNQKFPQQLQDIPDQMLPKKMFKRSSKNQILDIWEIPYSYLCPGKHNKGFFDLYSHGKNKQDNGGGQDDIRNWK